MMKRISDYDSFRAFRSVNYTYYFFGRAVSQFGTWMQRIAVVWVIYAATHSAFYSGVAYFAETFPSFLFSIPGGVMADRYDRYKIIKTTQIASMVQSVLLAALIFTGHTIIWVILLLSIILGIINAFDMPARQSFVNEVVADKADLPNALSLTTATASLAQLLGPALAGIVLHIWGAPICFLINGASFFGVFISVVLMKLPERKHQPSKKNVLTEFAEGFSYLQKNRELFMLILMLALISLLVQPYATVLPVFADVIFKGGETTFGYINSFIAIGAVVCTVYVTARKSGKHLKPLLFISTIILGVGLICFSQSRSFPLAMFFAVIVGFGSMAQFTVCNIIVQSECAPEMRGRVVGILLMSIFGMTPVGSLLVGAFSEKIGAPTTVLCEGILCLLILIYFSRFLRTPLVKAKAVDENAIKETNNIIEEKYE